MRFTNCTPLPASFARGSTGDREMVGVVATKLTCRVEGSRLVRAPQEDWWPVFERPHEFGGVRLSPETDFRKRAIDIIVFGEAVAPREEAASEIRVAIACGDAKLEIDVIGDRVWRNTAQGPQPSAPTPFLRMPLTNDRAFGGAAVLDGLPMPHSVNPTGRGLCLSADAVENTALPNLERPSARIRAWTDRPAPACLYRTFAPHIEDAWLTEDPTHIAARLIENGGQDAPPELVVAPNGLGRTLVLSGFDAWEELRFPVPALHGPDVVVTVGDQRSRFPTAVSTLVALVQPRALIITYRAVFRYLVRPGETRTAILQSRRATSTEAPEARSA
jgi:hypothetical protein